MGKGLPHGPARSGGSLRARGDRSLRPGTEDILGGRQDWGGNFSEVHYARQNSDGTLGSWSTTTSLTGTRRLLAAAACNGRLYVVGGMRETSFREIFDIVESAPILSNGSLGSWTTHASLPRKTAGPSLVATEGFLFAAGGDNHKDTVFEYVYSSRIGADGTPGDWQTTTSLPSGRSNLGLAAHARRLYAAGGSTASGVKTTDVLHAELNCAPAAPSDLAATAISGSQIRLTWTDNAGNETGFEVERRTGSGDFTNVTTTAENATGFTDNDLSECTEYDYRVRAVSESAESGWTEEVSATTPDTIAPAITHTASVTLVTDCAGSAVSITSATFGASASDACDASPALSISPSTVDPGTTEVTLSATDASGNVGRATATVTLLRGAFAVAFQKPLEATVDNVIKPGQTVPVKVRPTCGANFDSGAVVTLDRIDRVDGTGSTVANETVDDSGSSSDGGSTFRLSDDHYVFNLSTGGWSSASGARFRVVVRIRKTGHVDSFGEAFLRNK